MCFLTLFPPPPRPPRQMACEHCYAPIVEPREETSTFCPSTFCSWLLHRNCVRTHFRLHHEGTPVPDGFPLGSGDRPQRPELASESFAATGPSS